VICFQELNMGEPAISGFKLGIIEAGQLNKNPGSAAIIILSEKDKTFWKKMILNKNRLNNQAVKKK